jgi:hypothetical protein
MSIRGCRAVLLVVVAGLGVLAFAGAPAQAGQARLFSHSFGSATSTVPNPYPLSGFPSVAVDASAGPSRGDVYVADPNGHRVEKFDSSGHLILMFGKAVNKTKAEEGKPEAEQNLCLAAETCQLGTAATTPGAFQTPKLLVAVDGSAGSSAGDVYVGDGTQITKFGENGDVASSWANAGQFVGAGTPEGGFADIRGIAVDPSGNLWVVERRLGVVGGEGAFTVRAYEFTSSANLLTTWHPTRALAGTDSPAVNGGLTVDSSDHLYFVEEDGDTAEWSSTGSKVGTITSRFTDPDTGEFTPDVSSTFFQSSALTRDPVSGDVYQAGPFPAFAPLGSMIRRFAAASCKPSGEEQLCGTTESFAFGRLSAGANSEMSLAVDPTTPSDTVYAAYAIRIGQQQLDGEVAGFVTETVPDVITAKASSLTGNSARLNGRVNPSGTTLAKCFFEWGEGEGSYEHEAPCEAPDAAGVGSGSSPVEVHAQISGLTAGKTYHFRLVASNANTDTAEEPSRGADLIFAPPRVLSTSVLGVSATSAILQAELNAENVETHYHFEYATVPYGEGEGSHGTSVPISDASLGASASAVTRSYQLEGLTPSTVYYYRVVAASTLGITEGSDGSFTSQPALYGSLLPDGRVWERVSPAEKAGSLIRGIYGEDPEGVLQASADGDGFAYATVGSFGQEAPSNRSFTESQFLAFRGADGWSNKDVTPQRETVVGTLPGNTEGYKAFSQDLSLGMVQPRGVTPLSPLATETTPYLRVANGEFVPLVDSLNVLPETKFDGKVGGNGLVPYDEEPQLEGGSPDLHSVVIASCFKLTENAVNSCAKDLHSLYRWHEGTLQLASILPNRHSVASSGVDTVLGENYLKRDAVSEDGTRLVFSTGVHIYLRDTALAKTVQLDTPEPGAAGGTEEKTQFEDMSADGSKVFFTDTGRLTTNSDASRSHSDLYMCEIVVQGEALTCALKDLSVARNAGEAGAVLGPSLGADSSGRYIYFAANGALAPGADPGNCAETSGGVGTGTCGLYLYDTVEGTIKLVTTLSGGDYQDWAGGIPNLRLLTARVSPNGRFLAFMSQRSLTGYDNRDAVSGQPDQEVYLYDRLGDGGAGKLVCASCNPTGGRPRGVEIVSQFSLLSEDQVWSGGTWLAAAIPGWTTSVGGEAFHQSRYLSDSGRLFFNSADALVPRDSNGTVDVYEYELPQGEAQPASNGCTVASPAYSRNSEGCIDLISSGTSAEESEFLDASESGDDVFYLTGAQLVPADVDTADDIYDARVGGAVSEAAKPPACEGDACQNPVSAPEDPTPGSLTFQGPGNPLPLVSASVQGKAKPATRAQKLARALRACVRKPKRKRAVCERQAQRSYGPVGKAKKSNRGGH